jgi:hypothetical protein
VCSGTLVKTNRPQTNYSNWMLNNRDVTRILSCLSLSLSAVMRCLLFLIVIGSLNFYRHFFSVSFRFRAHKLTTNVFDAVYDYLIFPQEYLTVIRLKFLRWCCSLKDITTKKFFLKALL